MARPGNDSSLAAVVDLSDLLRLFEENFAVLDAGKLVADLFEKVKTQFDPRSSVINRDGQVRRIVDRFEMLVDSAPLWGCR